MSLPTEDYLISLLTELCKQPAETSWVEFKVNNSSPDDIGEYLSALSNAAALEGKAHAYLIWGVHDDSHEIVGTRFRPATAKKGNEELENWLTRLTEPRLHFRFHSFEHRGKSIVILEIPRASQRPTRFSGTEYIRVGSLRQKLSKHPQLEQDLWRVFDSTPFEDLSALGHVDDATVLSLLDYPAYFDLLEQPLPEERSAIMARLSDDRMLERNDAGGWDITQLGAILFARNLNDFPSLSRKALRIVVYKGKGRLKTVREEIRRKGYAADFTSVIQLIQALLPRQESTGPALRREVAIYPDDAIRELVPNALIHQDFSISGSGPMLEVFADRIEVTNPGESLVATDRFLDTPPRSRNEALASFMRRAGICEERGSGIDKVVAAVERQLLPAPLFEQPEGFTRVVLFGPRPLRDMDRAARSHACYLHACLRHVERDVMTNSSLRTRFGIQSHNSAFASRIIREAVEDGRVKRANDAGGKKHAKYLPFWA